MAVYTQVSPDDLVPVLDDYSLGTLEELKPVADGIENTNYFLKTSAGRFILTLFEKRTKAEDIPYFIRLMRHFNAKGIPCPDIMEDKEGRSLFRLNGKSGLIASFLDGKPVPVIGTENCFEVGAILARMHIAGGDFSDTRKSTLPPETWQQLIGTVGNRADEIAPGLAARLEKACSRIVPQLDDENLPAGPIHADLFPDNVFFDAAGKISGIIDFYFAYQGPFIYDIMLTLNAWCGGDGQMRPDCAARFMAGYQSIRRLTAEETAKIAVYGQASALRIISTRLYDWFHTDPTALVRKKDPLQHVRLLEWHEKNSIAMTGRDA